MKHFLLTAIVLAVMVAPINAQVATKLAWDQPASSLADAQALTYAVTVDGGPRVTVTATCTGTVSPFLCTTPLPALTPGGRRNIVVYASTGLLESASIPFQLSVPGVPAGLRAVP